MISHGTVSWTMRKALHWGVIYTLKISKDLWIKYKGGETVKKHIRQDYTLESLCASQFVVPNKANINTFVLYFIVL